MDKFIKFQKEEGGELPNLNETIQVLVKATALIADELDLNLSCVKNKTLHLALNQTIKACVVTMHP